MSSELDITASHRFMGRYRGVMFVRSIGQASHSNVKTSKFDGTSWTIFHRQFEAAAHNWWTPAEKTTQLLTALQGQASEILHSVSEDGAAAETMAALRDIMSRQANEEKIIDTRAQESVAYRKNGTEVHSASYKLSTVSFPGVKGGQSVVPTTPPHSSAEVMESMGFTSMPPSAFMALVMDVIKMEPDIDPLAKETDVEEEKSLLQHWFTLKIRTCFRKIRFSDKVKLRKYLRKKKNEYGMLLRNNRHHKARTGIAVVLKRCGWEVYEEIHCVSSLDSNRRAVFLGKDKSKCGNIPLLSKHHCLFRNLLNSRGPKRGDEESGFD
ncbi:hypothetical protein ANN_03903 [Periplaneta americana]|uniref:Uncharacterized protein n=1 Tax=Periplaneta americana TaxID=6978 RepID=A0ABQ8T735_PERAM|nr:hypothetical protein ANN_03903 [Periplaneta americana]